MPDGVTFDACAALALLTDDEAVFVRKTLLSRLTIWHTAALKGAAAKESFERQDVISEVQLLKTDNIV